MSVFLLLCLLCALALPARGEEPEPPAITVHVSEAEVYEGQAAEAYKRIALRILGKKVPVR